MTCRVDDNFPEHPKVEHISDKAFRLHVTALCYCTRNLTDGVMSTVAVRAMLAARKWSKRLVDELVSADLWSVIEDGFHIHDYLDWNPSAQEVKRRRSEARERMAGKRSRERSQERTPERSQERSDERSRNVPYAVKAAASTKEPEVPIARPEGQSELAAAEDLEAPRASVIAEVCDQFDAELRQIEPLAQALTAHEFAAVASTVSERCRTGHVGNPAGLLVQLLRDRLKRRAHEQPVVVLSLEDEIRLDTARLAPGYPLEVVVDLLEHKLRRRNVDEADWPRLTQVAMEAFAQEDAL